MKAYNPPHPGELLKTGCIDELKLNTAKTALKLGVSRQCLYDLLNKKVHLHPLWP